MGGTDLTHVNVTERGKRGGKPNISLTLSPFGRGLVKSTFLLLEEGDSTEEKEATIFGQLAGDARNW